MFAKHKLDPLSVSIADEYCWRGVFKLLGIYLQLKIYLSEFIAQGARFFLEIQVILQTDNTLWSKIQTEDRHSGATPAFSFYQKKINHLA